MLREEAIDLVDNQRFHGLPELHRQKLELTVGIL
jgi:hypothetical protein